MKGNRAVLTAIVLVVVIIAGWWLFRRGGGAGAADLIASFDTAEKRPNATLFQVADVDLNGETRKAIAVAPALGTRLIWKLRIPDDGWLRVAVGIKPEAWDTEGDGVLFRVGVSDGRTYEPLFSQHVTPFTNKGDRRWIPVMVDLSAYAGEEMEVIFNTNSSEPGKGDDQRGDLGLWGSPEIFVR